MYIIYIYICKHIYLYHIYIFISYIYIYNIYIIQTCKQLNRLYSFSTNHGSRKWRFWRPNSSSTALFSTLMIMGERVNMPIYYQPWSVDRISDCQAKNNCHFHRQTKTPNSNTSIRFLNARRVNRRCCFWEGCWNVNTAHRIHGTGIFTYIYHKNQPKVGI